MQTLDARFKQSKSKDSFVSDDRGSKNSVTFSVVDSVHSFEQEEAERGEASRRGSAAPDGRPSQAQSRFSMMTIKSYAMSRVTQFVRKPSDIQIDESKEVTIMGATFLLFSSAMGCGVLSLPRVLGKYKHFFRKVPKEFKFTSNDVAQLKHHD